MRQSVTILMTCAGGPLIPAEIAFLRLSKHFDFRIIGIDVKETVRCMGMLDGYYQIKHPLDDYFVGELEMVTVVEGVDYIIPRSDGEAFLLSKSPLFDKCILSPAPVLEKMKDKVTTYETMKSLGIRTPQYEVIDSPDRFPKGWISKPMDQAGGRGITDQPESFPCLAMQKLISPHYDVDVVYTGSGYVIVPRIRMNVNAMPFWGARIVNLDPDLYDLCLSIAKGFNLQGVHDIDLMTNPDNGVVEVLEINPRASASIISSIAVGYPLWDIAIANKLLYQEDLTEWCPKRQITNFEAIMLSREISRHGR